MATEFELRQEYERLLGMLDKAPPKPPAFPPPDPRDAEIAALRAEIARLEKDAARYRWLRDHWDEPEVAKMHPWDDFSPDPDQLDEQIDAAISAAKAGEHT